MKAKKRKLEKNMTIYADLEFIAYCLREIGNEAKKTKSKPQFQKAVAAMVSLYHMASTLGFAIPIRRKPRTRMTNANQRHSKKTKT